VPRPKHISDDTTQKTTTTREEKRDRGRVEGKRGAFTCIVVLDVRG
jgi:hypothetical protein